MSVDETAFLRALIVLGVEPRSVRDGAHEACHAIQWGVTDEPWDRDTISSYAPDRPSDKMAAEIMARAVEGKVCEALGVECDDLEMRAATAAMEAVRFDGYSAPLERWVAGVRYAERSDECRRLTEAVLALAGATGE